MSDGCYRFIVSGRVQGVYFRQSAAQQAQGLGVRGWVRNRPDGRVEGMASGDAAALETFKAWLRHGPPAASVDGLQWIVSEPHGEDGFTVRR